MAVTDVRLPTSTITNSPAWTLVGGATVHAILSDASDASYITQAATTAAITRVGIASHTPAAGSERHRWTVRYRAAKVGSIAPLVSISAWDAADSVPIVGTSFAMSDTIVTGQAPWSSHQLPGSGALITVAQITKPDNPNFPGDPRIYECAVLFDCRLKPSFVGDVLNAAGGSAAGGTITDTNRARLSFQSLNYDGLSARRWNVTVTNTTNNTVVFTADGEGPPPPVVFTDPLVNANYSVALRIWSTIRTNDQYASDITTLTWTQNFTAPAAPTMAVTVNGCDGLLSPHVEVCWTEPTPSANEFDSEPVIEIVRVDCAGSRTIYTQAESFTGCTCDRTMSINDPGYYCGERAAQAARFSNTGTGSGNISTPDNAAIDITGDIEIEIDMSLIDWRSPFKSRVLGKSGAYGVELGNWEAGDPYLIFFYVASAATVSIRSLEQLPFAPGERGKVKITHDVNDGAGSRVTTFYVDEGQGYRLLGDPITFGTAGSIDNSANALVLGGAQFLPPIIGHVHSVTLRNGIGGTVVANPQFDDPAEWTIGEDAGDSAVDSAGRTWTIGGSAGVIIAQEACLVSYRARYWGLVDASLVSSGWTFTPAVAVENTTPGNAWLRGVLDMSVCPDEPYGTVRPFGPFQAIGGGIPTVVTGRPGGRNYSLTIPVESEADLVALEEILANPLFFFQPSHAADLWLAPNQTSVQVTRVKRIRVLSVDTVAVNPQPVAPPESFF